SAQAASPNAAVKAIDAMCRAASFRFLLMLNAPLLISTKHVMHELAVLILFRDPMSLTMPRQNISATPVERESQLYSLQTAVLHGSRGHFRSGTRGFRPRGGARRGAFLYLRPFHTAR